MAKKEMTKEYEIHYYEVDFRKKMQITSLIDFLGDIATDQSEKLGVGMDYLFSNGLGWVLYKWDIKVYSYPQYGDKITIKTLPYGFRRFYAYRIYEVFNEAGELIAEAGSVWFLINIEKKKPVRIESDMYKVYGIAEDSKDILEIGDIVKPDAIEEEKMFNVRYSDIDTNKHVNNSKYASWALEVVPMDVILNSTLDRIKITYQKETKYGEVVRSKVHINRLDGKIICNHSIEDSEGNILALLETAWRAV